MMICVDCEQEKRDEDFYLNKKTQKYFNYCKTCSGVRHSKWRDKNREHHREYNRMRQITVKYGLTPQQYSTMKEKGCEICGSFEGLAVDHDHSCCSGLQTCGKCVRGLLCRRHNWAAGNLNDSSDEARKLAVYLDKTRLY